MIITIEITDIQIIESEHHADTVLINTTLPTGEYPFTDKLTLKFRVAKGMGIYYCRTHFENVPIRK